MEGLGAAVESLEDSIYLTNLLIAMGERHYGYRVKADMLVVRFVNSIILHLPIYIYLRPGGIRRRRGKSDSIYLTNLLIAMGEHHYGYRVKADMLLVRSKIIEPRDIRNSNGP